MSTNPSYIYQIWLYTLSILQKYLQCYQNFHVEESLTFLLDTERSVVRKSSQISQRSKDSRRSILCEKSCQTVGETIREVKTRRSYKKHRS